jgi:long-chain acyl-CoA synthetase
VLFLVVARAFRALAALWFGFRVSGVEHIPRHGPAILCPNHQSYFDGFFVAAALPFHALRRMFFVGAAEYYQTPMRRRMARLMNILPVDPDANLVAAMQQSAAGLRSNHVLMLFPEGERTIDGEIRTFRKGAAILGAHLTVPIVPVALDGPYALWPRGRGLNWRALLPGRTRVSLAFGAPLTMPAGAYAEGTALLKESVQRLLSDSRQTARP